MKTRILIGGPAVGRVRTGYGPHTGGTEARNVGGTLAYRRAQLPTFPDWQVHEYNETFTFCANPAASTRRSRFSI